MVDNRIISGKKEKTFLLTEVTSSKYDVLVITATDGEIESAGFKQNYDIDGLGRYVLLKPIQVSVIVKISEMKSGDIVQIDKHTTLTRLD